MRAEETNLLRRIYKNALVGYSIINFRNAAVYIKHFSEIDYGEIQEIQEDFFKEAKNKGLPTEQEKVQSLIEEGVWSEANDKKIADLYSEVSNLKLTVKKLFIASQIKSTQKQAEALSLELDALEKEKLGLIGLTSEKYAEKKIHSIFLKYSLFKDKGLTQRFFNDDEFDEAPEELFWALIVMQNAALSDLSHENLKKVAASPFCLNSLLAAKGNPFTFYGKAICYLTNHQLDLFTFGARFKSVIESGEVPPENLYNNIQSVVNWYEMKLDSPSSSSKNKKKSKNDQGRTVMGASKEEMKKMNDSSGGGALDLLAEANKAGKDGLSMNDLLKIHGET